MLIAISKNGLFNVYLLTKHNIITKKKQGLKKQKGQVFTNDPQHDKILFVISEVLAPDTWSA